MQPRIVVVGGGIAGLCAAIAFARLECRVDIFESSETLDEVGAGLQLSPNVTRLLEALGIAELLPQIMVEPPNLSLLSGTDLRTLCTIPAGTFARNRWHAPYGVVHRADLQKLLADTVIGNPSCRLHLGKTVSAVSEEELTTKLSAEIDGEPDLIVGADGVWSSLRKLAPGGGQAVFSGSVAWRGLAQPGEMAVVEKPENVNAFLASNMHLVVYPLGHRGMVNAVAVTPGTLTGKSWDARGDAGKLNSLFANWNEGVLSALDRIEWRQWPLFEIRNTCFSVGSKTVLIGDAAHAMTPHAAQGAAMAIEDACALAACFDAVGGETDKVLPMFQALRTPRIARVRKRGDFNRFVYHAKGPIRIGRDLVLSMRSPEKLAADLDWLYSYNATDLSQL